uniref:Uncharacterized protein n=1 Tax=Romanomermis culicivorax TaxID=13658 RepID=A0A915HZC4_ROMCU
MLPSRKKTLGIENYFWRSLFVIVTRTELINETKKWTLGTYIHARLASSKTKILLSAQESQAGKRQTKFVFSVVAVVAWLPPSSLAAAEDATASCAAAHIDFFAAATAADDAAVKVAQFLGVGDVMIFCCDDDEELDRRPA